MAAVAGVAADQMTCRISRSLARALLDAVLAVEVELLHHDRGPPAAPRSAVQHLGAQPMLVALSCTSPSSTVSPRRRDCQASAGNGAAAQPMQSMERNDPRAMRIVAWCGEAARDLAVLVGTRGARGVGAGEELQSRTIFTPPSSSVKTTGAICW